MRNDNDRNNTYPNRGRAMVTLVLSRVSRGNVKSHCIIRGDRNGERARARID